MTTTTTTTTTTMGSEDYCVDICRVVPSHVASRSVSCYDCSFVKVKRVRVRECAHIFWKRKEGLGAWQTASKEDKLVEEGARTCDCDSGGRMYGVHVDVGVAA